MIWINTYIFLAVSMSSLKCVQNLDMPSYIQPSLFSIIPPYIRFQPIDKNISIPSEIRKHLLWPSERGPRKRLHDSAMEAAGLILVGNTGTNLSKILGWVRTPSKRFLNPTKMQKISRFPGFRHVCHKDEMWRSLKQLKKTFPNASLSFLPQTFILPAEIAEFKKAWEYNMQKLWISKEPRESRGRGIHVLKHWKDLGQSEANSGSIVVQKYVQNPYLYENLKVELQYTFVLTSVDPLRIYSFPEALIVKLGKANYSTHTQYVNQRCMHIQTDARNCERSEAYYLPGNEEHGENMKEILRKIDSDFGMNKILYFMNHAIIMSLIAVQGKMSKSFLKQAHSRYTFFHRMSSDFVLDENGKPWMLEINSSPMRAAGNSWLINFDGNYYSEILNLAGFHFPPSLGPKAQQLLRKQMNANHTSKVVFDQSIYDLKLSQADVQKQNRFANISQRHEYVNTILHNLTTQEIRMLMLSEDELNRTKGLKRIFPTKSTFKYLQYIPASSAYYYKLFDAWELKCGESRKFCHRLLQDNPALVGHL